MTKIMEYLKSINPYSPIVLIPLFLFILFIITYHFWNNTYYKEEKFLAFVPYMVMIGTVVLALAFSFQIINYHQAQLEDEIKNYSQLSTIILDDILKLFIEKPEMNYYYEDLMGIKKIDNKTVRNTILENEITMLIFSKLAKFTIYHQETHNKEYAKKIYNWMTHITDTFMKSEVFRNYWINEYKPKLSGPSTQAFMKERYNL